MRRVLSQLAAAALVLSAAAGAVASDFGTLRVASVTPLPGLFAGPANSGLFLSPDGTRALHVSGLGKVCVHDLTGPQPRRLACADLGRRPPGGGDMLWSPDGARLILPLQREAREWFRDTDITLLDATTLQRTALTEDGFDGSLREGPALLDTSARWRDTGTILFVRQGIPAAGFAARAPAALMSADLAGTVAELLPAIAPASGLVTALDMAPGDGTVAWYVEDGTAPDAAGLYLLRPGEAAARRLLPAEALPRGPGALLRGPEALAFSADGRFLALLIRTTTGLPSVTLVETGTGRAVPILPGLPVIGIAWSPTGAALAYLLDAEAGSMLPAGLYLAEPPDAPGRLLRAGPFILPFCCIEPAVWARNDTMLLGNRKSFDAPVLLRFER